MIDLDHAATTPVKPAVLDAMRPFFTERCANASAGYASARQARAAIDRARDLTAAGIGANAEEIFFTSGGTEADNWALIGIALAAAKKGRRRIVTSQIEHHAVLATCETLAAWGFDVAYADADEEGRVQLEQVKALTTPDTALVSIMLANNEVGTIQPVGRIARIAHSQGALMHTDAVQAVGHIPVDVHALDVDLLSMSAHKYGGPKGVGALFVRSGTRIERLIHGGEQERGMRAGTENTPAIVGMGEATRLATAEMERTAAYTSALRDRLQSEIMARVPGARVNGIGADRLPGHLHVTIPGIDRRALIIRLDLMGIAASAGSACAAGSAQRSHVLSAMRVPDGADLRLTLGEENTQEEVEQVVRALERIVR